MVISDINRYIRESELYNYKNLFREYVNARSRATFEAGDRDRDAIEDISGFEKRREFLREKFIDSIGGLPPLDTPLSPVVTGVEKYDGFNVEKIIFESRPRTYVTTNLYVPNGITSPTGAVLFLCGHYEKAKHEAEYISVCLALVRAGLVVLAQDPIGQGERLSYFDATLKEAAVDWGVREHTYAGNQCLLIGDSIARYFVHDAMRSIDYLCSRPEVDPARIGVTGNSGGGTQTCLLMICDRRVAAAAPSTFVMSRQAFLETEMPQDLEQVWPGMSMFGFDHEDMLLAMAPKPVMVNAVKYDFFPIEGTRRTVERVKRFWAMYGMECNISLTEDAAGHKYTPSLTQASVNFFAKHLLGREACPIEDIEPIPALHLLCTKSGQVRADFSDARAVYEENLDRVHTLKQQNYPMSCEDKSRAIEWLKDRIFAKRIPCELNPRFAEPALFNGLQMQACLWWAQKGLPTHGMMFRDARFASVELPVTIALWDGGSTAILSHLKWIYDTCREEMAVLVLDVTADGVFTPDAMANNEAGMPFKPLYKFGCDLIWLDDSIAAMQIYDVIKALDMVQQWPGITGSNVRLYGNGDKSICARLVGFLGNRVRGIQVENAISSLSGITCARYYNNHNIMCIILPGILKYLDLPDIDSLWDERVYTN